MGKHKKKHKIDEEDDFDEVEQEEQEDEADEDEEFDEVERKHKGKKKKKKHKRNKKKLHVDTEDYEDNADCEDDIPNSINSDYHIMKATEQPAPDPDDLDDAVKNNNWTSTPLGQLEEGNRPNSPAKRRSIAFNQMKYNQEGLNADFELTPWVPPDINLAKDFHTENVLKGGKASLFSVDMCQVQDCGNGVPLFFLFMKTYTVAFFIMTLLAAPAMLLTTLGDRTDPADRDSLGIYKMTIGNIGYALGNPNYKTLTSCGSASVGKGNTTTCITFNGQTMTMEDAGVWMTYFELAQVLVFFLAFIHLRVQSNKLAHSAAGRDCNIGDYAVWVKGIPDDCTIEKLISHFSHLYQLGVSDWRKRPPLFGARPVLNVSNTEVDVHFNTWVAEATIYRKLGSYIRAFKNEVEVIASLKRARAFMKMYKEDTCHADGPNPKKYSKWEDKMLRRGQELDQLTEQLMYYKKKNSAKNHRHKGGAASSSPTRRGSIGEQLEADAHCAFIVFNYSESRARCLEDYQGYSKFPWNLCYPAEMKFRGTRVTVQEAPEPDEIIWENIEIPPMKKLCSRIYSLTVTFIFIVIGFAIILEAAALRGQVKKITPNLGMCKTEIPSLFQQSYEWGTSTPILVRPPSTPGDSKSLSRSAYDAKCKELIPNSFYVIYADKGDLATPIGKYDINACKNVKTSASETLYPVNGPCPQYNQSTFCPCFSTTSTSSCKTLGCSTQSTTDLCSAYQVNAMSGCYCSSIITSIVSLVIANPSNASTIYADEDECVPFFKTYATSMAATYGSAISTVVINIVLKNLIVYYTKKEYYDTTDVETGTIVKKVFVVTYFNMAVVVLLAFGYLKGGGEATSKTYILNGDFIDFTVAWYGQVGTFLVITFITNAIGPWMVNLPKFFILRPLRLWFLLPKIVKLKSHKIAMQSDCNRLLTGRVFDYTLHYAQLLAMMFLGMTFAPGIPIFMPLLAVTFGLYHILNKLLILRHYQKPPHMGIGMHEMIMIVLPYAGFLRLAVGIWMFANHNVIPSKLADVASIPGYSNTGQEDPTILYNKYLSEHQGDNSLSFIIISRVVRANVLPLFVLLAICLGGKLLEKIAQWLPFYYIMENLGFLYIGLKRCCSKMGDDYVGKVDGDGFVHAVDLIKLKHPLRNEMAAYTDEYYKYIEPIREDLPIFHKLKACNFKHKFKLTPTEENYGWTIVEQENWITKMKIWKSDVYEGERLIGAKGSNKLTFQVISDDGCYSYALDRIPDYQVAMKGLRDNMDDYKYDEQNNMVKVDEHEHIVEKFLREKKEKEKKKHEKVAEGSLREKPWTPSGSGGSHNRVIPDDAQERYRNATEYAKHASRDAHDNHQDEDEQDFAAARHIQRKNKKRKEEEEDDDEEYEEERPSKHRSSGRKTRGNKYRDEGDDDDVNNRGVSGLV